MPDLSGLWILEYVVLCLTVVYRIHCGQTEGLGRRPFFALGPDLGMVVFTLAPF